MCVKNDPFWSTIDNSRYLDAHKLSCLMQVTGSSASNLCAKSTNEYLPKTISLHVVCAQQQNIITRINALLVVEEY